MELAQIWLILATEPSFQENNSWHVAKDCSKHFKHFNAFQLHNFLNSWGKVRLNNQSQVTRLVGGGDGFWTQGDWCKEQATVLMQ